VWLAAVNKTVQKEYWELIKTRGWQKYPPVATIAGADAIIEHILVEDPDFYDLESLSAQIESGTMAFCADIQEFIAKAT
jgi:hypothetical protein